MKFILALLFITLTIGNIYTLKATFQHDRFDNEEGITLRAVGRVSTDNLRNELNRIEQNKIKGLNLIDQGFINKDVLEIIKKLPNLMFLNVSNTGITEDDIEGFKDDMFMSGRPMISDGGSQFVLKRQF
jgi:hypothetical protein